MKHFVTAASLASALATCAPAAAEPVYATPAQAEQIVAKAVAAVRKDNAKTFAAITAKDPAWVQGDLYPVVYDMHGKVLAHGQNARMVGKDVLELRDADGKAFIRERMELAATKASFWQDYAFVDPITKSILPKRMYCERSEGMVICAGIYKRH
ncbi:histidine kinase [Duganella sp. FT92W]|uniref:Histidine kinase n=1 Tax=Pseudoduganella rivuli TaxID=2666085 RepID=A0A7X2ILP5_9BURK|nr:cache domain-containing protein [Pseudoduganella rivuli]MRV72160.1 histidine kinase [Pseudoduganella rivuli]